MDPTSPGIAGLEAGNRRAYTSAARECQVIWSSQIPLCEMRGHPKRDPGISCGYRLAPRVFKSVACGEGIQDVVEEPSSDSSPDVRWTALPPYPQLSLGEGQRVAGVPGASFSRH